MFSMASHIILATDKPKEEGGLARTYADDIAKLIVPVFSKLRQYGVSAVPKEKSNFSVVNLNNRDT